MSSTMVTTVAQPSLTIKGSAAVGAHCPSCGFDLPPPPPADSSTDAAPKDLAAAQSRIAELENEVRVLNDKAAMAMNRWAEYEAELTRLRSASPHAAGHGAHLGAALRAQDINYKPTHRTARAPDDDDDDDDDNGRRAFPYGGDTDDANGTAHDGRSSRGAQPRAEPAAGSRGPPHRDEPRDGGAQRRAV
ncbi:hypothetical protein LMH87_002790 [Akanthomyces muscarius]|uniref:Uncharacterized protein n=1 Tax=Akanthomyces muscarius TaxID=2231603 RepID=A0A9W8UK04_AKAMU|nr:hypothetical protein LMH87_002790 [Akanthomyces muscarius]KAJ4148313.1 hypothetical protein LMH87_002790 [Akanthomyces muscarius]